MARKGILSADTSKTPRTRPVDKPAVAPRGAVGALQSSLTKLQESAVQEIDTSLIDDAGVEDRLGIDEVAQEKLKESLQDYGQQVPVLVRPHASKTGRYEIVYGRRRLIALKELGMPVKAMVRQLNDQDLVMAQGQENTARQDLSFIEKASFAHQLHVQDFQRETIAAALSIDLPMLSRMLKVGAAFTLPFLRIIGPAPGIGRDRWLALARIFEESETKEAVIHYVGSSQFDTGVPSDERFEAAYLRASKPQTTKPKPAQTKPRTLRDAAGKPIADIRTTKRGVTLNIPSKTAQGFDEWVNSNAEALLQDLHDRWNNRSEEN